MLLIIGADKENQTLLHNTTRALEPGGLKPWTHAALTPDAPDLSTAGAALELSAAFEPEPPWYKSRQVQLSLLGYAMVSAAVCPYHLQAAEPRQQQAAFACFQMCFRLYGLSICAIKFWQCNSHFVILPRHSVRKL